MLSSHAKSSSSSRNLAGMLENGGFEGEGSGSCGGSRQQARDPRRTSLSVNSGRVIIASNHLPLRVKKSSTGEWQFEFDEDALTAQAKDGVPRSHFQEVLYVGGLPVDVEPEEQENIAIKLRDLYNCCPVYLDSAVKERFYKGFCKQQLWPLFHYVLPGSPSSSQRFNVEFWQAYVKANKCFADKIVEESLTDTEFVWIHDYHLLVLPSLLRKRFNRIRAGVFLHSPFPSSEIFRTFPKREELLRSLLNADLIGFHTFDYARHFLSCCSRMLGLEHETSRGSITIDYYGRTVGIKIMPTGVNPKRYLDGFSWDEFKWRRGELEAQFKGMTVLAGVDDMDSFKGIDLKLQAFERLLEYHAEWRGKVVLVQVTNPPRSTGHDITELHAFVTNLVASINYKYGNPSTNYVPVHYLERRVPLHERMAFYSIADCVVVTATRDGMNLVPYEYIVCRQGPDTPPGAGSTVESGPRDSMLVVSEFVGCSPSLSGAIRVNPWSIDSGYNGMYAAICMPLEHRRLRHQKHWRYVSQHTVAFWAQSYLMDLVRVTRNHVTMKCYGLGLGLDTFRMVALDANFRKMEESQVAATYKSSKSRVFFLDYDGTLTAGQHTSITLAPLDEVLQVLRALTAEPLNKVVLFSGRPKAELQEWFASVPNLALVAENGCYLRLGEGQTWRSHLTPGLQVADQSWVSLVVAADFGWKKMALPILQQYQESTDGSSIEAKESALVWYYKDADPDFGSWQAKELLDHLEGVSSNKPVEIVGGSSAVEIKPQGVSKGQAVEKMLGQLYGYPAIAERRSSSSRPMGRPSSDASERRPSSSRFSMSDRGPSAGSAAVQSAASSVQGGGAEAAAQQELAAAGKGPDFVLCIGDDRSDEDMFTSIEMMRASPQMMSSEVYACTVGQKPSRAPLYLNDPGEVLHLLARLVGINLPNLPL
uniref:Trehalose-6-phosphate synthase n=1 Tax=Dunaliella viridis TaxID=140095 RepID=A0A0D5ZBJ5_9CHLO|nr:trehalose-6-phosphate synthase [Dunaliella viridis]